MVFNNNLLLGAAGAAGGYSIDQSIRFNDNDSARLERTVSSSGSTTTWTTSVWVKRGKYTVNTNGQWFPVFSASNGSTTYDSPLNFNDVSTGGAFNVSIGGYNWRTSALARDTSAWYHVVTVWDSSNGTTADRMRLYINGERVTDFSSSASPSSGANSRWNSSSYSHHRIGNLRYSSAETTYVFDGYLAEINFIDGQALDPSSFGEFNADTGQWVPIAYTGSYGTNGFYITGENSADLGADYSGNSNNFTSSGLTSADQVTDTPTDNYSTWNSVSGTWLYPATFSDGNLTALRSSSGTNIVRSTISFPATGNWYAEFTIDATGSGSHVWQVGVLKDDDPEAYDTVEPRASDAAGGYMYITNWSSTPVPSKANNSSEVSYGTGGTATDIIGVHLNNGSLTFYHNNTSQGVAYTGLSGDFVFAWSGQGGAQVTANFGQSGFTYTPPSSAVAVTTANLSDPTIADPTKHFNTVLWTATGATNAITGVGFQPDFIWGKKRTSSADNHGLVDAVRGNTKQLASNLTDAELTNTNGVQSFDADGFTLAGSGAGSGVWNGNVGSTHVAWNWKANGSGSSNTDGDVTSTVSANTASGFSVVTYTPGIGVHTWGHGLGVAPSMVIVKDRGEATNWQVYHSAVGPTKKMFLNTSDLPATDSTVWNNTAPTSSVVTTGSGINDAHGFVAYCFAEVDGFSKAGSYVANASTDGPFVYCGFRPAWVIFFMIAGSGAGRSILDSVRDPYNPEDSILQANTTAVESSGSSYYTDFLSNGFKLRTSSDFNGSGRTVAFMAFAESPFKTANAR